MVPVVCVVGKSGAGKTFVIQKLVAELKNRAYRVATIKHSHHGFELDKEGKDSWRHAQAGSDAVIIGSPRKMAVIKVVDRDQTIAELSQFVGPDFDIILAEGFKQDKGPKIEVHRKEVTNDLLCKPEELFAIATDVQLDSSVPQFALDDASGLVDLIENTFLNRNKQDMVSLFVNGELIPLNSFVQGIFSNTLSGMVASLKNVPHAGHIEISIRRSREKARE
ncbi:MAG: molybdopterin-guanine dinucleotide biosynthesis protein B [Dehalococcoidia bacterium]